ncbi:unnamed protein product [Dicrocoelium dendriticum]|nr:unnamed protein product [Dicrocoelium dendriticum]
MTLIVCLAAGVLVWAAIACIMSYPVISATLLLHRQEGPTRLLLAPLSITDLDKSRRYIPFHKPKFLDEQGYSQVQRKRREELPRSSSFVQRPLKKAAYEDSGATLSWLPETLHSQSSSPTFDLNSLETINAVPLPEIPEPLSSPTDEEKGAWRLADLDTNMSTGAVDDGMHKLQSLDPRKLGQEANRLIGAAAKFFRCAPNAVDLSYYGLYDEKRLPICLSGNRVDEFTRELAICSGIAMVGILMVITGHVQIAICATINYTRLQRHRYYECSDVGEEGEALHQ